LNFALSSPQRTAPIALPSRFSLPDGRRSNALRDWQLRSGHQQVLEHATDLDVVVHEIARVLKPGGSCLSLFPDKGVWREGHCGSYYRSYDEIAKTFARHL